MNLKRLAGPAGLLVVVMAIVNVILMGSPPAADGSIADLADYVANDNSLHKVGLLIGIPIAIPFLIFLAGFLIPVMKSDREHGEAYAVLVFGGALLLGAGAGTGDIGSAALHLRAGGGLGEDGLRVLQDLSSIGYAAAGIGSAVLGLGAALVILQRGIMARWVGWVAALSAVGGLFGIFGMLSGTGLANLAIVSFITNMLWVLAVSIEMMRSATTVSS